MEEKVKKEVRKVFTEEMRKSIIQNRDFVRSIVDEELDKLMKEFDDIQIVGKEVDIPFSTAEEMFRGKFDQRTVIAIHNSKKPSMEKVRKKLEELKNKMEGKNE